MQNKNSNDLTSKISFCVNCDPSNKYSDKSINLNTLGNEIALIHGANEAAFQSALSSQLATLKQSKTTVNTFFNTCYRNYNFSDGKSLIRAGSGGNIGKYVELPVYAPVAPKDASLFLHSYYT